jgi:hypothetical protein
LCIKNSRNTTNKIPKISAIKTECIIIIIIRMKKKKNLRNKGIVGWCRISSSDGGVASERWL